MHRSEVILLDGLRKKIGNLRNESSDYLDVISSGLDKGKSVLSLDGNLQCSFAFEFIP